MTAGDKQGRSVPAAPQPRIAPGPASGASGASLSQAGWEPGVPPTFPGIGSGAGGQRWAGPGIGINARAQPQPGRSGHGGGRMRPAVRLFCCLLLPLLQRGKGSLDLQLPRLLLRGVARGWQPGGAAWRRSGGQAQGLAR